MLNTVKMSRQTVQLLEVLLSQSSNWHYGYDLSRETGLKSGTLYPILVRLSDRGWLETRWEASEQEGRPPRHLYRLTGAGLKAARTHAAASRFSSSPSPILGQAGSQ